VECEADHVFGAGANQEKESGRSSLPDLKSDQRMPLAAVTASMCAVAQTACDIGNGSSFGGGFFRGAKRGGERRRREDECEPKMASARGADAMVWVVDWGGESGVLLTPANSLAPLRC
jgi:hypothetical protein